MRGPRLKISWVEAASRQHVFSRAVNGEFYFEEDYQKEKFCEMMWRVAEFCGLDILTFVAMANHFHIEIHLPMQCPITDDEMLRRYALLHGGDRTYDAEDIETIRARLIENGPWAVRWRAQQIALMGDVSQFMKLLKQRYSIWYNAHHQRFGTLWAERFGNVLIDGNADDLTLNIATYIDLNPVRAGLVKDPADYRFSGYGAAVGGDVRARRGMMLLMGSASWEEAQAAYRVRLFAMGSAPKENCAAISEEALAKVIREKGKLPVTTALLKKTNYFRNTLVLGTREFVEAQLEAYRKKTGALMKRGPQPLPSHMGSAGIFALRRPRPV